MEKQLIDTLRIKFNEVKTMTLSDSSLLYWVKCRVCGTMWVATDDGETDGICFQEKCQDSFEAKVINAIPQDS